MYIRNNYVTSSTKMGFIDQDFKIDFCLTRTECNISSRMYPNQYKEQTI